MGGIKGEARNFSNQGDLTLKLREMQRLVEHQGPGQLDTEAVGTPAVLTNETDSILAFSSSNPTIATWSWRLCWFSAPTPTLGGEQGDRWCWYRSHKAGTWHINFENSHRAWVQKEQNQLPFIESLLSTRSRPATAVHSTTSDSHKTPLESLPLFPFC